MKPKRKSQKFVLTLSNPIQAEIFADEMLGLERAFRRGITQFEINENERIAAKIFRALAPVLRYAGIAPRNPRPRKHREVARFKAKREGE